MTKKIISVILPVYNGEKKWLSEAIDSVLNQSFGDFEFIIINDASTNDIEKTILEYLKKDSRILYIKNPKNLGLTKTLNKGISISKGQYIARIDQDDIWWDMEKLKKQIEFLENNKNYWICWSEIMSIIDENNQILNHIYFKCSDKDIREKLLQYNQFCHSSILIRKESLTEFYNTNYYPVDDYELWCRIGKTKKIANIKWLSVFYRTSPNQESKKRRRTMAIQSLKVSWKYRKFYDKSIKAIISRILDIFIPQNILHILSRILKLGQ